MTKPTRVQLVKNLRSLGYKDAMFWKTVKLQKLYSSITERKAITKKFIGAGLDAPKPYESIKKLNVKYEHHVRKNEGLVLAKVNSMSGSVKTTLDVFNKIFHQITAPADQILLLSLKNAKGESIKTINLENYNITAEGLVITEDAEFASDVDVEVDLIPAVSIELEWMSNPKGTKSERKSFFRYLTNDDFKLEDFQVYHRFSFNDKSAAIPCFLFALAEAGVDKETIKQISQNMIHYGATTEFIRNIATMFNIHISIKQLKDNNTFNISHYGNKGQPEIKLASIAKHLFAIKQTKITKAALLHSEFAVHDTFPSIVLNGKGSPMNNPKKIKYLDSYEVISYLYNHRDEKLIPITQSNVPELLNNEYQKVEELSESDFNDNNFKMIGRSAECGNLTGRSPFMKKNEETQKYEEDHDFNVIYFDFETLPIDGEDQAYCVAYKINNEATSHFYGFNCAQKFLNSLPPKSNNLLFAHNAGFDVRFIMKHFTHYKSECNIIECGTRLKQLTGAYYGRNLVIKDTLSFINSALAKLPTMFPNACEGLTLEKESFPHQLINKDNFDSQWSVEYLKENLDKCEFETLMSNAKKVNALYYDKANFDCKRYAIHYCKRDVDVLYYCFEAFRKMFIDRFSLDVYRFMSMPSVAYAIQHNEGCFDGCFAMSGVPLSFARQAIVGGRVMTRDNLKHHTKHQVVDFDAVSLYPSAQSKLPGYTMGIPKLFKNAIPEDADDFIVRIVVDTLDEPYHFPLQSIQNKNSREFSNFIEGKELILGKQALMDLVEFQKVSYTVIEGMYWNSGFNVQITETIKSLFAERLKLKAEGNPLQEGIKLLMNSAYGKLIQKPIIKQKVLIKGEDKINEYMAKNIPKIISKTDVSYDLALFEEHRAIMHHFSPAHLGVQVLDMSKHIMNEVMCLADDIESNIWYQDTDSMHIDRADVPKLAEVYKNKYGRELIGKQLGQFHSDFSLDGSEGEVYATESWFLGKKSYLDVLACDGNDTTGFHIRMKGIPSKLLQQDPIATYKKLYAGDEHEFDLAECCPIKIDTKTQSITRRMRFPRIVSF